MPEVEIVKTKLRRGSNEQRKLVTFDQGEIVATTDTKRVFVGTGSTLGGVVVGSKVFPPLANYYSLSTVDAEVGDLINVNNKFYQLITADPTDLSNWNDVSANVDPIFFEYDSDNNITILQDSISAAYISSDSVSDGIQIENGVLKTNLNSKSLEISALQVSLKAAGIDEREISSSALSYGLLGGSGDKIYLDIDTTYFSFNGNKLSLSASPIDLQFSNLSPDWFSQGLYYDAGQTRIEVLADNTIFGFNGSDELTLNLSALSAIYLDPSSVSHGIQIEDGILKADVDPEHFVFNGNTLTLSANNSLSGTNQWPKISVDEYGKVVSNESSILDVLTGDSSLSSFNSTNSLSAIYNGDSMGLSSINITKFTALSSDGTTVLELSSAGFITFEGNTTTRNGTTIGRFAIPIYRY